MTSLFPPRTLAAMLLLGLGSSVLAVDDEKLLQLQLRLFELQRVQKQKVPPPAKELPVPSTSNDKLPVGAIARLGDTRLRHAAPVTCVAYSRDGRQIITGGQDQTLRVWDAATGEARRVISTGYIPTAMRLSHGGTRLAIAISGSQIRFLDPDTLKQHSDLQAGIEGEFAVSPDGKLIAVVGTAGILVSELNTGLPKLELALGVTTGNQFAFHPEGKSIAVGDKSGKVTFYMLAGGKPLCSYEHGGPITGLAIRKDGKQMATGSAGPDEIVKVWDLSANNPQALLEIAGASKPKQWLVQDRLALSGREGAGVYDLKEKKWISRIKSATGEWAISPDGTQIAAVGNGSMRIRVWELATGKQLHARNDLFPDAALLEPTPDGQSLFVLAGDGAFLWPIGKNEATSAGKLPANAIVAATGGGRLVVATPTSVLIYDEFDPAKPIPKKPSLTLTEFAASPRSIAVSPDGSKIAYSGEAARIVIADAATGKTIRILPTQTIGLALAFSPDSKSLAVLGRDAFVRLWSAKTLPKGAVDADLWKLRVQRGLRGAIAFSPDGKLVAASSSAMLVVLNAESGETLFRLDRQKLEDGVFQQIAFSPDSRLLVTGSAGTSGAVQVFNIATHSIHHRYTTEMGAINRLVVFPNGSQIASAGAEDVITVWEMNAEHAGETKKLK